MKKKINLILIAFMASIGLTKAQGPAIMVSDKTGWHKIAETTVDFSKEHDEVSVILADRFAAIQFKVENAPINITTAEVFFESGDNQKLEINSTLMANEKSKVIQLNSGERRIKSIAFFYKTLPNSKDANAHLEIWGLKTNADEKREEVRKEENKKIEAKEDAKEEAREKEQNVSTGSPGVTETSVMVSDKTGWHKIGERTVDFVKDTDQFIILGADRFTALKFKAVDASIVIFDIDVYSDSGEKLRVIIDSPLAAGKESKVVYFKGGEQDLDKIIFKYKTIPNQTADKATIEVWGLKSNITRK